MTNDNASSPTRASQLPLRRKPIVDTTLVTGLPTLLALAVMGFGWMVMHRISSGVRSTENDVEASPPIASDGTLTLPKEKLNVASLESEPARPQILQHVHTVPGRLQYDQTMHVDVTAPMDGILAEIFVTPGDQISTGDLIAVLRSPEVGQARAEILKRQAELDIAQQLLEREQTLANNLKQVSAMLDQNVAVDSIESAFVDRSLGVYRQEILSAYAKLRLADELHSRIKPLIESGAVSGRLVREREAERQLAETSFRTAQDQASFSADQAKRKAAADVAEANRQLNLAWQSLETLLGYEEDRKTANLSDEEALSRLEVRAPFDGSIESRSFSSNERVMRGESLVVLANTDSLAVEANIRESDWSAVSLQTGSIVSVIVPALDGQVFDAKVRYFGREVNAETNSVPLVALINNDQGLLRPGMFVRVTIPIDNAQRALSVKPQSVTYHANQPFVFVDMKNGVFRRVDIATGRSSDDWVEVTDGLSPGVLVVTKGAFLLKSELLLQGEGE